MVKSCPVCLKKGKVSRIKIYQINWTEATIMCENVECPFPFLEGVKPVIFKRHFKFMNDPVATMKALSEHQENFKKSEITEDCGGEAVDDSVVGSSSKLGSSCETSDHCNLFKKNISELESELLIHCQELNNDASNIEDSANNFDQSDSGICKLVDPCSDSQFMTGTKAPIISEVTGSKHGNNDNISSGEIITEFKCDISEEFMYDGEKYYKFEHDNSLRVSNDTCLYECTDEVNNIKIKNELPEAINSDSTTSDLESTYSCEKLSNESRNSGSCLQVVSNLNSSEISNSISCTNTASISDLSLVVNETKSFEIENDVNSTAVAIKNEMLLVSTDSNSAAVIDDCSDNFVKVENANDTIEVIKGKDASSNAINYIADSESTSSKRDLSPFQISGCEAQLEINGNDAHDNGKIIDKTKLQDVVCDAFGEEVKERSLNNAIRVTYSDCMLNNISNSEYSYEIDSPKDSSNVCSSPDVNGTKIEVVNAAKSIECVINKETPLLFTDSNVAIIKDENCDTLAGIESANDAINDVKENGISLGASNTISVSGSTQSINDLSCPQFSDCKTKPETDGNDRFGNSKIIDDIKLQNIICNNTGAEDSNRSITTTVSDAHFDQVVKNRKGSKFTKEIDETEGSNSVCNSRLANDIKNFETGNDCITVEKNIEVDDNVARVKNGTGNIFVDVVRADDSTQGIKENCVTSSANNIVANSEFTVGVNDVSHPQFSNIIKSQICGNDGCGSDKMIEDTKLLNTVYDVTDEEAVNRPITDTIHNTCFHRVLNNINSSELINEIDCTENSSSGCISLVNGGKITEVDAKRSEFVISSEASVVLSDGIVTIKDNENCNVFTGIESADDIDSLKETNVSFDAINTTADCESKSNLNDHSDPQFLNSESTNEIGGNYDFSTIRLSNDVKCDDTGIEVTSRTSTDDVQETRSDEVVKNTDRSDIIKDENCVETANNSSTSPSVIDIKSVVGTDSLTRLINEMPVVFSGAIIYTTDKKSVDHPLHIKDVPNSLGDAKENNVSIVINTVTGNKSQTEGTDYFPLKSFKDGKDPRFFRDLRIVDITNPIKIMCDDSSTEMIEITSSENEHQICSHPVVNVNSLRLTNSVDSLQFVNSAGICSVASSAGSFNAMEDASCPETVIGSEPIILDGTNNPVIQDSRADNFKEIDDSNITMGSENGMNTLTVNDSANDLSPLVLSTSGNNLKINESDGFRSIEVINNSKLEKITSNVTSGNIINNTTNGETSSRVSANTVLNNVNHPDIINLDRCETEGSANIYSFVNDVKGGKDVNDTKCSAVGINTEASLLISDPNIKNIKENNPFYFTVVENFTNVMDGVEDKNASIVENNTACDIKRSNVLNKDLKQCIEDLEVCIGNVTIPEILKNASSQCSSVHEVENNNNGLKVIKNEALPGNENDFAASSTHTFAIKVSDPQVTCSKTDSRNIETGVIILNDKSCIAEFSQTNCKVEKENENDRNATNISTSELQISSHENSKRKKPDELNEAKLGRKGNDILLVASLPPVIEDNLNSSNDAVLSRITNLQPISAGNSAKNLSCFNGNLFESFAQKNPEILQNLGEKNVFFHCSSDSTCDPENSLCERSLPVTTSVASNEFEACESTVNNKKECHIKKGNDTIKNTFEEIDSNPCCLANASNQDICVNTCDSDNFSSFTFSETKINVRKQKAPAKVRGSKYRRRKR